MQQEPIHLRELYGVVGFPLQQSLSPVLHTWGFQKYQLPCAYLAWSIDPQHLPHFLVAVRTLPITGVSVTIPHKQDIIPYLDRLSEAVLSIGAVNTLYWREGQLWGENTDLAGFIYPLSTLTEKLHSALILGAGGAALSCIEGLERLQVRKIAVTARDQAKLEALGRDRGITPVPWEERENQEADLLVNATPLGMKGKAEESLPLDPDCGRFPLVYDLVYNPEETKLLRRARDKGCGIISGMGMFVEQAREQFRIWTGEDLPAEEMTSLVRRHLA